MMDSVDIEKKSENKAHSYMVELSLIYKCVKPLILLSEYYNSNQGIVLSAINELRNSFDHIMRAFFEEADMEAEFSKAKGHLYRSAFDVCEIIIIDRLEYINQFKNSVGFYALYKSYPKYYTEILPFISEVKEKLASLRQNSNLPNRIEEYENIVTRLIQTCDDLDQATPFINERYKKVDKTILQQTSILATLLGFIAVMFSIFGIFGVSISLSLSIIGLLSMAIAFTWLFYKKK